MTPLNHSPVRDSHSIAALIDHTILKPEATRADIERLCKEAVALKFATVCVNPVYLPFVAALLHNSEVKACAVIGFPLGANLTATKLAEAQAALADGALELDMVIHIGGLKSLADNLVSADIRAVADVAHDADAICKVIIETCLLNEEEKIRACRLAVAAGADFVKTSTGFGSAGQVSEARILAFHAHVAVVAEHADQETRGELIVAADLSAAHEAGRAETARISKQAGRSIFADCAADMAADVAAGPGKRSGGGRNR